MTIKTQGDGTLALNHYANSRISTHHLFGLLGVLIVASLPALFGHAAVSESTSLYHLAQSPNPYFQPSHAGLLYLWTPCVVLSACVMLYAPGLLLAMALGAATSVGQWMTCGFALNVIVINTVVAAVQSLCQTALTGSMFGVVVILCILASFVLLIFCNLRSRRVLWPSNGRGLTIGLMVIGPLLVMVALAPKFYWENFNGDGAHAYESARLVVSQLGPFWPAEAGDISSYPSWNSWLFIYPNSWFIRLFGEVEASARLPLILYLMALYAGIIALVQHGRAQKVGWAEHVIIWIQLAVYIVVMGYSATYNPYFADLALPATQDTQTMVCLLGLLIAWQRHSIPWTILFIVMLSLSLPNGLILVGLLTMAVALFWRPRPWRLIITAAITTVACVMLSIVASQLLRAGALPTPGDEYAVGNLLSRLEQAIHRLMANHSFDDLWPYIWSRAMYLVLPCGILPALTLAWWSRQDRLAHTLALVCLVYYFAFALYPHAALHHFVPVMILPLVVFWRTPLIQSLTYRRWVLGSVTVSTLIALMWCLPQNLRIHTYARTVGITIEDKIGGYNHLNSDVFVRSEMLSQIIPHVWQRPDTKGYGGSPLMWNYYAHLNKMPNQPINYIMQHANDPPPDGMRSIAEKHGVIIYLHDDDVWQRHQRIRPPITIADHIFYDPGGRGWSEHSSSPLENSP